MHRWSGTTNTGHRAIQQRHGEGFGRSAPQQATPPVKPARFRLRLEQVRCREGLGGCQRDQELLRLLRPATANLSSEDDRSFRLLASTRIAPSVRSAPCKTEPSRANGDTSVVSLANCAPQGEAFSDNLQPPVVDPVVRQEVQVVAHPGSCLSADSRNCSRAGNPSSQEPQRLHMQTGVAKVVDGHTGTHVQTRQGEGGDGAREAPWRAGNQTASTDWLGER